MKARSQLHAVANLLAAKEPAVLVSQETEWDPEFVWGFWRREISGTTRNVTLVTPL